MPHLKATYDARSSHGMLKFPHSIMILETLARILHRHQKTIVTINLVKVLHSLTINIVKEYQIESTMRARVIDEGKNTATRK